MRTRRMKRLAVDAGLDDDLLLTATDNTDNESLSYTQEKVIDIDAYKSDDPTYASIYVNELYIHMKNNETLYKVSEYFNIQVLISQKLRGKCVDFVIQMCYQINARNETLYATITLLDRYLSLTSDVKAPQLILLSLSCLMISYKFEEVYFNIHYAIRIADELIASNLLGDNIRLTKEKLVKTEVVILKEIQWELGSPNLYTFLVRYLHVSDEELNHTAIQNNEDCELQKRMIRELTACISDRILIESSLLKYLPSQLAAAALFIARFKSAVYGIKDWTATLEFYSRYSKKDLDPVVKEVLYTFQDEVDIREHHDKMKKVLHVNEMNSDAMNFKANILNGCLDKHGQETYQIVINSY